MDDEDRLDGEEEMELDEASDGEDEDEETTGIPVSPANSDQLLGSTPTPVTPDEVFPDPLRYQKFPLPGGKPLSIRRGPGRPRKERPPGVPRGGGNRRSFGRGSFRGKGFGYGRGVPRRTKSKDDDTHSESPSPLRLGEDSMPDGESSGAERPMPAPEEPPYFPEQWQVFIRPGKVCALCNLGERSQLGQGELLRLTCPEGFTPEKNINRDEAPEQLVDISAGDKSPRTAAGPGAVTCRRQKSLAKCRNTSLTNYTEPVEELTIVGYIEEPELSTLFESSGHYYVHQSCAVWSSNSQELATDLVSPAVVQASSRRCAYCSRYGAGIPCKVASCNRYYHLPCAAASSCFQETKSLSLFCSQHLGQVPLLLNGDITCMHCYGMGDVSNLVMCSICGQHYHGSCVGLSLLPDVRAGWQCANCRLCQVCRQPEDVSKVMLCERCEKAYHPGCLRPIVTSIPKYGWKCKCCRVCTDCGSRTPGAGLSSRWHSHYTVCDSCYQQRNKGFSCPLCRKAYRAAAYREMVQCSSCKKFVHGTCDPEADPMTYQHRKEAKPDYEYICLHCKNMALVKRKDNFDDYGGDLSQSASQESLYGDGDSSEFDYPGGSDDALYSVGLGKGKPFCASKIAKKRLGLGGGVPGRPKGIGKLGYQKRQKMNEFGRKRGPKAKMRGIFGVPGVGLQRPISDSFSKEDEPGVENRLVLCSAKDKFVLTQDICVMCGAIGTDQEGCLIACAQCGQCYHPYCANVKVTKVILQKGWRCLDCTVCEGCGERNDEGRLILCDDCDISYHIYCMDPPLDYVPHGTWKCKWCAQCQTCGSNDPGFNSSWQKNYTQCGPCASHTACISCQEGYAEGDLIIQCIQCERWLHCACDSIKSEADAEKCAEEGYICILCRPRDVPPPHLVCSQPKPQPKYPRSPPPAAHSPELYKPSPQQYLVDGVYLSEAGMNHIKSLTSEHQQTRKKRRKLLPHIDKEADIMATIESVVAGGSLDNSLEENGGKLDLGDVKDEPTEVLKEGMVWTPRGDQPPPEGFSIYTTENGIPVLRRKRQRNLQKLGIGGFTVRLRGTRKEKEEEGDPDKPSDPVMGIGDDKPRRKPQRRKPKTLSECFPLYMQEAFFGKELMDTTKEKDLESSSESDSDRNISGNADTIQLSQDELKAMEQVKAKQEKEEDKPPTDPPIKREEVMEEDGSDTEALGDILPISGDLLDSDLVNTIMNEADEDLAKASEALEELDDTPGTNKDELTDILSPHFNLESMVRDTGLPNMDSKDVEEIFKGVLTDESQESQESSVFSVQAQPPHPSSSTTPLVSPSPHAGIQPSIPLTRPTVPGALPSVGQSNLNSPMSFPPPSPYHSEYSNSPQFSPAFSEPPSPWVNPDEEGNAPTGGTAISYNQRSNLKMEADEALGSGATISSVLYANMNHPEWKTEYPAWSERCKQILKKWRALPNEKKAPYLTQARENRSAIRMKKTQQIPKDISSTTPVTATSAPTIITKPVTAMTSAQVSPVVAMASSNQRQIGLLTSASAGDKSQEKNGLNVSAGTGAAAAPPPPAGGGGGGGGHHAEVCAVQGPPKQLTSSTSPSLSPTSTTPSSSPRPSSVNSISSINGLAHQEARITQSPATPSSCTSANASSSSSSSSSCSSSSSSSSSISTSTSNYCNTFTGEGQHQTSPSQQRPTPPTHITIGTSSAVNGNLAAPQATSNTSGQVSGPSAGPVRQFSSVDHQIRVLTPSEIMRTLPSLSQEHYDPPPTAIIHTVPVQSPAMEQDRLSNRDRSTREAEQERQWKQLQALRQQQAQIQQQVIHEQRVHAIARVHRQISEDNTPQLTTENNTGLTTQLQVTTSQDGNQMGPLASPSPGSRATFVTPPIKVTRGLTPQSPHQGIPRLPNQPCGTVTRPVSNVIRPGMPSNFTQPPSPFSPQAPQSPHDFPQSPASSQPQDHFQRFDSNEAYSQGSQTPRSQMPGTPSYSTSPRNDVFSQPPGTPRPMFNPPTPRPAAHVYAPSRTPDPYSSQPPTPSPASSYSSPRPESRQDAPPEVFNQQPEVNRQLRDLLQRQQFTKKLESANSSWPAEGQNNVETTQQQFEAGHVQIAQHPQAGNNAGEGTFRHPLPPGIVRPRMPIQPNVLIRTPIGLSRHPTAANIDPRLQGADPRMRMLLQRQPASANIPQQHYQGAQVLQPRMPTPRNPLSESYDLLQQQRFTESNPGQNLGQRIMRTNQDNINQGMKMLSTQGMVRPPLIPTTINETPVTTSEASEIPENVTAELEKLEQEGAPMVEVEGVSAILGDIGEDDDELLAEMGADFNILEYADPELDNITGGEKTNILDLDLEQVEVEPKEEKQKKETKDEEQKPVDIGGTSVTPADISDACTTSTVQTTTETTNVPSQPQSVVPITAPSPTIQQNQTILPQTHPQAVVVQQQMHQHVQQAAAMGRPMPPGTRLLSPDGAVGVVTSTNTVTVSYPTTFPGHPQRLPQTHVQVPQQQQQRLGMRVSGVPNVAGRVVAVNHMIGPRMPLAPPPPPPPPPYPGPPPPYPGPMQMGLCPGGRGLPRPPVHIGHPVPVVGPPIAPIIHTGAPTMPPHPHRRPLLLQEQPLLLEELLEQEKREQEKQQQQQQVDNAAPSGALLSDSEFERLRADVLGSAPLASPPQGIVSVPGGMPVIRPPCTPRPPSAPGTNWSQAVPDATKMTVQVPRQPIATQTPPEPRVTTFNVPQIPAPPAPPETIVTEQDRQTQLQYEQWLNHQHQVLTQQLKYYETEVQKLRKMRKNLNSKQRSLRKTGNELTENDAAELQRISTEQAILQKHLDASRKQTRQHGMLVQEYHSKQQQRQSQSQNNEPCSPLMSPSQHSSPMHSPAALVSQSPGPGNVPTSMIQHSPAASIIQHSPNPPLLQHSPGNQQPATPGTMSPHNVQQQSPRIGTPHSQGEESPFSPGAMPSPGICGPTGTRMTSPQHRAVITGRLATSPGAFTPDVRPSQPIMTDQNARMHNIPQRFVRPPAVGEPGQRMQGPRMQLQGGMVYGQRSPLGSPQPTQQPLMAQQQQQHQQILQRQQIMQQQQQQQHEGGMSQEGPNVITQRTLQMVQQRQQIIQQQQQQMAQQQRQQFLQMQQQQQQQQHQMQKPPNSPMVSQPANSPSPQLHQQMQQNYGQPPSSPMPRSPMVQQTMGSPMLQQQLSQTSQPPSPMNSRMHPHPPSSPMVSQYQPPSPMSRNHPSTSPMLQHQLNNAHHPPPSQTPSSPMPRSPMVGGSPMQMQRRQSTGNSPAMPDRPQSVENPGTPRTPHTPHANYTSQAPNNMSSSNDQAQQQFLQQQQQQQQQQQYSQQQQFSQQQFSQQPQVSQAQQQQHQQQISNQEQHNSSDNRGGGNPHNPMNPLPITALFGRYGYFKLGLRGGSPMWSMKAESSKGKTSEPHLSTVDEKSNASVVMHRKTGIPQSKINSLVCADYNDFDDDSHTPPQTSPSSNEIKNTPTLSDNGPLGSPGDKLEPIPDTTDYDDDKTIVNTEVTLSSTAQRDNDDITVIEQFGDTELVDVISGTLEADMEEEYVLFEPDMVVDLSADSNDSLCHALVNDGNQGHDLVQILEIENTESHPDEHILSDEDLVPTQARNKKSLRLDIVRTLQAGKRFVVTDTPESPDQEELQVNPSPSAYIDNSPDQDLMVSLVSEPEVVIIDPSSKSPEDNLSKESCEDETEKVENIDSPAISKENVVVEMSTNNQQKNQKETKLNKSPPTPFIFPEKVSYSQVPPSSIHQANIGIPSTCRSTISYPTISTTVNAVTTAVTTTTMSSIASTSTKSITTFSTVCSTKETATAPTFNSQKQSVLPYTMASIVADAKIAAKLSQTAMQSITVKNQQSIAHVETKVSSPSLESVKQSALLEKLPDKRTTTASNNTTQHSKLENISFIQTCSKLVEPSTNVAKLVMSVQPTSVTLSTPKMSIPEIPKNDKPKEQRVESLSEKPRNITNGKEEKDETDHTERKEDDVHSVSSNTKTGNHQSNSTEEKKADPLNTTDELESMLEAIHNPAENTLNRSKNTRAENKTDVNSLKRMSPVADDLSLVNILENDSEVHGGNEDKGEVNTASETPKTEKLRESTLVRSESNSININQISQKEKTPEEPSAGTEKMFVEQNLNEDKNLMEESSDEILDMLHNIISSKPEMANADMLEDDRSRKSSLIYDLPAPLDTLPLNILQDSLLDLEQGNLENDHSVSSEKKPLKMQNTTADIAETVPKKPSPVPTPTTTQQAIPQQSLQQTPLVVSTVAQLQKSTTSVPHLSPLSKPTELTSNVANVSHQLRTLLSSLQTNHSQVCTTATPQPTIVTMVSSVITGPKMGTTLSSLSSSQNSTTNTSNISNARSQNTSLVTSTVTKMETESTSTSSSNPIARETANTTVNVTSSLPKSSSSDIFSRVAASGPPPQSSASLNTQHSSVITSRAQNTGVTITSNAMLNAMLAGNSTKSSTVAHRASIIPTQAGNMLSSALPSPTATRPQSLQAILQVSTGCTSMSSRVVVNTTSNAMSSSMQCVRTIIPPLATTATNAVNVTTSILQSTLSQAPTLLHTQLTSGQSQYKSSGIINNKNSDMENATQNSATKKDTEESTTSKIQSKSEKPSAIKSDMDSGKTGTNSHRMEESQNVLLKQLLQNTACATTTISSGSSQGPSLPIVPSLEAQLAIPVPPTPSSLLPPILNESPTSKPSSTKVLTKETSFLSNSTTMLKTQTTTTKEESPKPTVSVTTTVSSLVQQRPSETFPKQQMSNQAPRPHPASTQPTQQMSSASVPIPAAATSINNEPPSTPQQEAPAIQSQPKTTCEPVVISSAPVQQHVSTPMIVTRVTTKPVVTTVPPKTLQTSAPQTLNNIQSSQPPPTMISAPPQPQQSTPQISMNQKPVVTAQQLQSPQNVSTIQPTVPQPIVHPTIGPQTQAPQSATSQHTVPLVEVKKEVLDEVLAGGTPTQLTDTKDFLTTKEELMDGPIDDKTDLKKLKRRQYQQKRKQSQGKDAATAPQKKRSRKVSRLDEDYDTFIDNLMIQLRQLQPMAVLEPLLGRNYGVCPMFGSGDLSKIGSQKDYNSRTGDLTGSYGTARLAGVSDHYNTQPFGELEPLPPQQPASTQRGFYDQEFPPLKLDDSDDKKENTLSMNRDVDSPDTIVSSSSPECVVPEFVHRFPGLRLIEEESDEEADWLKRVSPVIPLVSPIPIRLKPPSVKDLSKHDKENLGVPKLGKSPSMPLRENGNVTVTLTLNSQAADDIMGVLKDLANILNIAPPTGYQIVERTTTPPSQKLGLYRTKGKDGKEGAPIDIQSILNGAAKFCRHCDVVILNSLIRKKVSDLPFLSKEEAEPGDELCFCSVACYMQFALMHRTPTNNQEKAATIVDHLCQKAETKLLEDDTKKQQEKKFSIEQSIDQSESMDVDETEVEIEPKIKTEIGDIENDIKDDVICEEKRPKKHPAADEQSSDTVDQQPPAKVWRGLRYKTWSIGVIQPATKYKKPTDREITEMLFRMGVTVIPAKTEDSRRCMFCQNQGDGTADGPARLLNFDVDKWVHLNCALWSEDVYETVNGALMNLDTALQHSLVLNCIVCEKPGATVKCFKMRCTNVYHLGCAVKDGCVFYKNKSTYCSQHIQKNEKDNELTTLSVYRRVYVNRDENRQVAAVMHHSEHNHLLRVGSLIFLSVGQLLPHQLANFHTPNYIYPVGYKIVRFYWSMRRPNKRCRYVCSIHDVSGRPEFRVLVQEPAQEDVELRDATPRAVWSRILEPLAELRRSTHSVQLFPRYVTGEDLFGLTEPAVVRVLESLPGIETLTDYRFKYGRNPLLELPLAINPTGSARTEARLRHQLPWKRPHTQRTGSSARASFAPSANVAGETACPYSKQFVHSKSSQYKKMKQEWRNNVYLARSKIQGLGLYAARDLEKHTMVIEYIGEIIRTELAETREKQYEARNRGIYMFRLDEERVVDATLCGGLARYINHSCNPNCVAEIVEVERDLRIIIFAKRRISRGEELAYDYKFDIEDDQHKIACACGAPNCRKWMN